MYERNLNLDIKNVSYFRLFYSLIGIIYVWSLPLLSELGFSEKNSTSISQFISNPQATGAMSAISFIPLTLMWEYQDLYLNIFKSNISNKYVIEYSLSLFQIFYSLFLIFSVSYAPMWLHTTVVIMFCISFIIHSIYINHFISINLITKIILIIGCISFFCLLFAKGMWFWVCECIGFSSMILFTPIDWYFLSKNDNFIALQEI